GAAPGGRPALAAPAAGAQRAGPAGVEPPAPGEAFVHISEPTNVSDDFSDMDNVLLNGQHNAAVFATRVFQPYAVNLADKADGVWYDGSQWAVYHEDQALMTDDYPLAWNIFIPPPDAPVIRHLTTGANTLADTTWFSHTALNNHPEDILFVQHVYNPTFAPGGNIFTPTVTLFYDNARHQWGVFRLDDNNIPNGTSFYVLKPGADDVAFQHLSSAQNI